MQILSSSDAKRPFWGGGWLLGLLLLGLGWLLPNAAFATHLRAGDIQAKIDTTAAHNPNRVFFKLTLYRDNSPGSADQPTARLYFGDGTNSGDVPFTNPRVSVGFQTERLTYYFDHTFPGSKIFGYEVSFVEANRSGGVVNMFNSVGQTFYISTTITIDPGIGLNHLPVLRKPAIDQAAAGQVFLHNPAAYDQDHDSLSFKIKESQQVTNFSSNTTPGFVPNHVPCDRFVFPNSPTLTVGTQAPYQVLYTGVPPSPGGLNLPAIFVQDPKTGQITWNAPLKTGIYNVAFVVEEWRRNAFGYYQIGAVIRDMQILVTSAVNQRPTITVPPDTCVVAGTTFSKNITAVDANNPPTSPATAIKLSAYSGILPPATFVQSTQGPPRAVAKFTWTPQCEDIAKEPYIVVFDAQDTPHTPVQPNDPPLIDEKPWRVTVVGPAPTNLKATINNGNRILLDWDRYYCQTTSVAGVKPTVLIFRREGCFAFTPSACQTGLPAGSGYVQIGSVPSDVFSFIDANVVRGRTYSYRIYVSFPLPGGGASLASNEACLSLNGRSAQITNVDVLTTDAGLGQISVKWTRPQSTNTTFNAPLGYRLSRSTTGAAPFTLVATKTSITDTTYVDTNLNTVANQYTYQLVFFSAAVPQPGSAEITETAPLASSVRLGVVPDGLNSLNTLTWNYAVPWDNSTKPTVIYRRIGTTGPYTQVATQTPGATSGTYVDRGLVRGTNYCYYVQTNGIYASPINSLGQPIYPTLLNRSQEQCAVLNPTPCTPVLTLVATNCDSLAALPTFPADGQRYQNRLRWTLGNTPTGCSSDVAYFRIYYRSTADGTLVLLDSTTQYTYLHRNLINPAGCYAVQAVNSSNVRSAFSNVACQDNCVFFVLPNIFTPNGDNLNEKFRPKTASPILRTHIQIFNRWGRKVYESDKDPLINWDGGGAPSEVGTSGKASDGIYYYLAEVEFADFAGTKRTYKGWVEIVR
jgi:gliding motility-associated-like protein